VSTIGIIASHSYAINRNTYESNLIIRQEFILYIIFVLLSWYVSQFTHNTCQSTRVTIWLLELLCTYKTVS